MRVGRDREADRAAMTSIVEQLFFYSLKFEIHYDLCIPLFIILGLNL